MFEVNGRMHNRCGSLGEAFLLLIGSIALFPCRTRAQNSSDLNPIDPIINFCSRFQHQSTVKNGVLYLDGGIQTYRLGGLNYSQNGTNVPSQLGVNNNLITTGMNESWNWWTNISQVALEKSVNPTGDFNPEKGVIRGSMFSGSPDDNKLYTFGGTSFMGNQSFPGWQQIQSSANPLWSYDTVEQQWTPHPASTSVVERPNYGASAEATDKNMGFYLNGQIDSGSRYTTQWMDENTFNLPGMVVIHLNNQTMTNISTPGLPDTYPRVGGSLQYLPNLGEDGILISLGGAYRENGGLGSFNTQKLATFEQVDVFDISSYLKDHSSHGSWYSQSTSGDIPPPLIDSCVVALSAPDLSSHNIYLYGGRDPMDPAIKLYDGIWSLSLPSFTWTKIIGGESPRWGHSCSVVGNRQLLTVGGSLNRTYDFCDWEQRGVAIFDLSTMLWGSVFAADAPPYNVSQPIVDTIGGTGLGGATLRAPVNGYNNAALESVLRRSTDSALSTKTPKATVIGATVGSTCGFAIIIAIIYLLYRRRHRHRSTSPSDSATELANSTKLEFPAETAKFEMSAEPNAVEVDGQDHVAHEMPAENEVDLKREKKANVESDGNVQDVAPREVERRFPRFREVLPGDGDGEQTRESDVAKEIEKGPGV